MRNNGSGSGAGLPRRLIITTMIATPGAPATMYENEVRFYSEVRPELSIEAPVIFASRYDRDLRFKVVVDLRLMGADARGDRPRRIARRRKVWVFRRNRSSLPGPAWW